MVNRYWSSDNVFKKVFSSLASLERIAHTPGAIKAEKVANPTNMPQHVKKKVIVALNTKKR